VTSDIKHLRTGFARNSSSTRQELGASNACCHERRYHGRSANKTNGREQGESNPCSHLGSVSLTSTDLELRPRDVHAVPERPTNMRAPLQRMLDIHQNPQTSTCTTSLPNIYAAFARFSTASLDRPDASFDRYGASVTSRLYRSWKRARQHSDEAYTDDHGALWYHVPARRKHMPLDMLSATA